MYRRSIEWIIIDKIVENSTFWMFSSDYVSQQASHYHFLFEGEFHRGTPQEVAFIDYFWLNVSTLWLCRESSCIIHYAIFNDTETKIVSYKY